MVDGRKHIAVLVEDRLNQQLEILFLHSSGIVSWLSDKCDLQRVFQAEGGVHYLVDRVVQYIISVNLQLKIQALDCGLVYYYVLVLGEAPIQEIKQPPLNCQLVLVVIL